MLVGIVGSIIGEPLKLFIKRQKIEKALYRELDHWYERCQTITNYEESEEICQDYMHNLKVDVFDHYFSKERDAVFAISNWQSIRESFDFILRIQKRFVDEEIAVDDAAGQIESFLEMQFALNALDKDKSIVIAGYLVKAKEKSLAQ